MFHIPKLILILLLSCQVAWAGVDFQDNSDDKISFPSAGLNLNAGTVCMLVKNAFATTDPDFNQWFDSDNARHAFFHNGASNEVQMYNDGRSTNFSSVTWTTGVYYDFCFVYNKTGNVQKFYKDGVEQTGDVAAGTWGGSSLGTSGFIGSRFNQTQSAGAVIDEVAIWSTNLTAAEMLLRANSKDKRISCQISPSTLLNLWNLDDVPDGTTANAKTFIPVCGSARSTATGDDGANNTGLTAKAEEVLSYP